MRKVFALAAAFAAMLAFAGVAPSAARADTGLYIAVGDHGYYGHKHHYKRGHHAHKHFGHKRHYRKHRHRHGYYGGGAFYALKGFYGHGHRHGPKRRHGGYGCHFVSKDGYWRGKPALIGGTMCYDRFGNGYVVKGSRHLVRYYY